MSPSMIKDLNKDNRRVLCKFMCNWVEDDNLLYEKLTKLRLVSLLKKGDLHYLNS